MQLITWNVNGLRSVWQKKALDPLWSRNPDLICLQETKAEPGQLSPELLNPQGYEGYFLSALRKGYSGVAVYARQKPLRVIQGLGVEAFDDEGRVLTLEYPDWFLVNCYVPNAQAELVRLPFRMAFDDALRGNLQRLGAVKPVVLCGDLNVAHQPMDLKNPKSNEGNPGYSPQERAKFTELLDAGFVDVFRNRYPERVAYTWWSYRQRAREKNVGWRIDYFVTSPELLDRVAEVEILDGITGSDHCPVALTLSGRSG